MAANPLVSVTRGTHSVESGLTPFQLKAAAEMHIGTTIKLPFHSKLISIKVEDDRLAISYQWFEVTTRARETVYASAERVLDVYTLDGGVWSRTDRFSMPDGTFRPHAVHEAGTTHRDEAAQRERRIFEGECYRPGTGKAPMDNAARTAEGYTTPQMERHWS